MNFTVTSDKYILYIIEEVASKFVVLGITASIIVNLFHQLLRNFRKPEKNRFQRRKINQTIKINTLIKVDVKSKIDAIAQNPKIQPNKPTVQPPDKNR